MRTIYAMLLRSFLSVFLAALFFFIIALQMVELFSHLWNYIQNNAGTADILRIVYYYLPTCLGYALPPALLFAISYTLGSLYSSNQLIAILGAGIPFGKLIIPFLALGMLFSAGYFLFHENVIIYSQEKKTALQQSLLGRRTNLNNPDVTVIGEDGRSIYRAEYYNDNKKTLSDLTIVHRNEDAELTSRIECDWAEYEKEKGTWVLHNVEIYNATAESLGRSDKSEENADFRIDSRSASVYRDPEFEAGPSFFQRKEKDMDTLSLSQAREWVDSLRRSGRPSYHKALTEYYSRFSYALTPFIVTLISCGIGNRLKKNIVLMSLLFSLVLSVVYYVAEMVLGLFAKQGIIVPALGAWGAVLFFLAVGVILLRMAKT